MKIIYLHQYYNVPTKAGEGVGGTRSYEFSRRWAAAGHEVHVLASDQDKSGKRGRDWHETREAGATVHWLPVAYSNKMGFAARVKAFINFALAARKKAASLGGDVIFATSTPLTIAIPGIYASKRNNIPLVFEVRDLWPEAPRQMGVLTNPVLFWLARQLELAAYRNANYVIALSPGMADGVAAAGMPRERIAMIPNSCDLEMFRPDVDGAAQRTRLGFGNRLALLYFGTMGPANGLDFVLDTAVELKRRGEKQIVLVLHGDGKMRPHLENRQRQEGLDNVVFSAPLSDKTKVAEIVAAADVGLTIYKNLPILHTCSPNKMFDTLAAGRPVLTNMPGWLADTITKNHCGVFVQPDQPKDFADQAQWLLAQRAALPEMGRQARALAEREFARDVLARQLLTVLERAAKEGRAARRQSLVS